MNYYVGPRSYSGYLDSDDIRDLRKYQKAQKIEKRLGDRAIVVVYEEHPTLISYWTQVCCVKAGKLIRLWDDWSSTTAKHISLFCREYGLRAPSKKEWMAMPIGE